MSLLKWDASSQTYLNERRETMIAELAELDVTLLYRVADDIKTGWELCDSRWQSTESEIIACQAIKSCRSNHERRGEAFSWCGSGLTRVSGGGLMDNPAGLQKLLDDGCVVVEPYVGEASPPKGTVVDSKGKPLVLRVTQRLLEYAAGLCGVSVTE